MTLESDKYMRQMDLGRVALVTDSSHNRNGEIAEVLYSIHQGLGGVGVKFADGHKEEFHRTRDAEDYPNIKIFYRHPNEEGRRLDEHGAGPRSLQKAYRDLGLNIINLEKQYRALFDEPLHDFYAE